MPGNKWQSWVFHLKLEKELKNTQNRRKLLFWVENEQNRFCMVLTDKYSQKERVCVLFSEISVEKNFFFVISKGKRVVLVKKLHF